MLAVEPRFETAVLVAGCLSKRNTTAEAQPVNFVSHVTFFVAMPPRYLAGMPFGVTVVGTIHGVLFVALVMMLLVAIWNGKGRAWEGPATLEKTY